MSLSKYQKGEIKRIVKEKLVEKAKKFEEKDDMNKPFYAALFSEDLIYKTSLLHSVYTWFGSKWTDFAEIVAKENFESVKKRRTVEGEVTTSARSEIDSILDEMDNKGLTSNIESEKNRVLKALKSGQAEKASQQVDLILKNIEDEYYFEIKSTKPNKNEVKAAKRDLLKIIAMEGDVKVYLALPYNPYFSDTYDRWTVTRFFREGKDLLVGKEFWNFLGGKKTYDDLLSLFKEVGERVGERVEDILKQSNRVIRLEKYTEV